MTGTQGQGLLVVFEGTEGVGKTTQVARLHRRLDDARIATDRFREPGGTPLGDQIRALLLDPASSDIRPRAEALLFMAGRAQLADRVRSRIHEGRVVLLDRFFLSTYAYQIAGRGLPAEPIRQANALAVDDLVPDVTLLLACDLDVARARTAQRGDLDRMEQESRDFHERVTLGFLAAADPAWQAAHREVGPVVRIDADGDVDTVGGRIEGALTERWPETFKRLLESQ